MIQVSLFFHALWILCGLAAVVLTAEPAARWPGRVALAAGFASGLALAFPDRPPEPVWVGGLVAVAAALVLFRPAAGPLAAVVGGTVAAVWGVLLHLQGTPLALAMPVAAAVPMASEILAARHRAFAPEALRDEALLVLIALGLLVAMAPGAVAGWQSAEALNADAASNSMNAARQAIPAWTLVTTLAATCLGGAYAMWMRR